MDIGVIRKCTRCDIEYPHHGARDCWCKGCKRSYDRQRRKNFTTEDRERRAAQAISRKRKMKQKVTEFLKCNPCVDCGESNPVVLQFDHIDQSTKIMAVSKMVNTGKTHKVVFDEVAKCEVRCGNCHAVKTAEQCGWYIGVDNV